MKKVILSCLLSVFVSSTWAADELQVMVGWFINPVHGQIVIGIEKGFFEKYDLDVSLIEPSDTSVAPKMAAAKKVDLASDSQPHLYMQRQEGMPLMKVTTIMDMPLNSLLVRADSDIKSIADLKGKTIGYSLPGFDTVILGTMLKDAGLSLDDVETVNINFLITQSLLSKKVDGVIGAYRNFENIELGQKGVKPLAFYPEEHRIPVYDDMILVAHEDLQGDPRFARFNQALTEATVWIINHPEESWQIFSQFKEDLDTPLNHESWKASLARFSKTPGIHNRARYDVFEEFLLDNELLEKTVEIPTYQP